jgi:hypothetical protein
MRTPMKADLEIKKITKQKQLSQPEQNQSLRDNLVLNESLMYYVKSLKILTNIIFTVKSTGDQFSCK